MTPLELLIFITQTLVFPGFAYLFLLALFTEWYVRKLAARFENRLGPTYTGPHGLLQPLADFVKLLFKEEIELKYADNALINGTLIILPALFIAALFVIPWLGFSLVSFEGDLILVILLTGISSGLLYAIGWFSKNPYSVVGAVRAISQYLAFDIPLFILLLVPAVITNSLSISTISHKLWPSLLANPWLIPVWALSLGLVILVEQAELEENPFSIPHAEQEIVAGYFVEISGRRLAFYDLARDMQILLAGSLIGVTFLGLTWNPRSPLEAALNFIIVLAETLLVIFELVLIKCVTARLRIDQVLEAFWTYVIPLSIFILSIAIIVKGGLFPWV